MKIKHLVVALALLFLDIGISYSQKFSQELGIIAGPVAFKSDYGLRGNSETNFGNMGIGVGLVHYLNFAYRADCNCYSRNVYFNDHFKLRTELDYHSTRLEHHGDEAEKNSIGGIQLRAMHAKAEVIEAGSHLEWFPLSIRDFDGGRYKFAPYISLGAHGVIYSPKTETDLPGRIGSLDNTFGEFIAPRGEDSYINDTTGITFAVAGSIGTRYKLAPFSDLLLDARVHWYASDFVDGLNHNRPQNKYNDWIFWLNLGYIIYLD